MPNSSGLCHEDSLAPRMRKELLRWLPMKKFKLIRNVGKQLYTLGLFQTRFKKVTTKDTTFPGKRVVLTEPYLTNCILSFELRKFQYKIKAASSVLQNVPAVLSYVTNLTL